MTVNRIAALDLNQINRQLDNISILQSQVADLQKQLKNVGFQITQADPVHAPATTNNLNFIWTGSSTTLSWVSGWLKDKNWKAQTTSSVPAVSSAPGVSHIHAIPAGSLTLNASTAYWLGWNPVHQTMIATTDASSIHSNYQINVIAQVTTGSASASGTVGGGGSNGVSDLSGLSYPNTTSGTSLIVIGTAYTKIQAGTATSTGSGSTPNPVTFPAAFTTTPRLVIGNYGGSANIMSGTTSSTGFSFAASSVGQQVDWIAMGN
jgi:hypothetical protein